MHSTACVYEQAFATTWADLIYAHMLNGTHLIATCDVYYVNL